MTEDMTRMRALASEIATLERKYRALHRTMARARARWDRQKYERAERAQEVLGTSEAAVRELAGLLRMWGLSFEDLATLDVNSRTVTEVCRAFEGWEVALR